MGMMHTTLPFPSFTHLLAHVAEVGGRFDGIVLQMIC